MNGAVLRQSPRGVWYWYPVASSTSLDAFDVTL